MGYSYQVFVDTSGIGHAFIQFTDSNGNSETWGYYSRDHEMSGPGDLRNDAQWTDPDTGETGFHKHDWDSGLVELTEDQYNEMRRYAKWVDDHPAEYGLLGNNCVEFVEDMLRRTNQLPYWTDATDPRRLPAEIEFAKDLRSRFGNDMRLFKAPGMRAAESDLYLLAQKWRNYSPMVLDLDGDGIETIGADNPDAILFDHDGDGIKTGTGWIKADDALLVLDRNGNGLIDNGSELFGVDTVLANGHRAADGYVAMRELDSNGDGVLNSADGQFADLKIWRDLNQDGASQANELQSLGEAGIASLDLNATPEGDHLLPGWNWQILSSTYTRTDGTTATLADINFADNGFYREFPDQLDTSAVQDLPAMAGSGLVRDLQEAATLSTGLQEQLRTLQAQGYVDRQTYLDQIKSIIDAWADTSRMDTATERTGLTTEEIRLLGTGTATSTGLHYIEATGSQIGDTQGYTIDILYRPDGVEGDLIKLEAGHMGVGSDYTRINALTDAQKAEQLAKWQRVTYLIEVLERFNGMPFIDILPDKVTSVAGQHIVSSSTIGSASIGSQSRGLNIVPVLVTLSAEAQIAPLEQSYDQLVQSVYEGLLLQTRFTGYMDAIDLQIDETGIRLDFTRMEGMLAERYATDAKAGLEDLIDLIKVNDHLIMGLGWTNGLATLRTWAGEVGQDPAQSHLLTELNIKFVDGTVGSVYDPVTHEIFLAGAGNDTICAGGGDDLISAGAGDDYINSGAGADTIVFNRGDGRDNVGYQLEADGGGNHDILQFGAGIAPGDIKLTHSGNHLLLGIKGTTDQVTLLNYFESDGYGRYALRAIQFADGTRWDVEAVKALVLQGTDEADELRGFFGSDDTITGGAGNDVMNGLFGNDTLDGGAGNDIMEGSSGDDLLMGGEGNDSLYGNENNDTLIGGAGNDYLYGGAGSDTYIFNRGDGQDNILNDDAGTGKTDVLQFAADINSTDVTATRNSNNLILTITGATDSVSVLNYFNNDGASGYVLDEIRFGDGVSWNLATVNVLVAGGTAGNDNLYGTAGDDWLDGLGGNDYLYGGAGNDGLAGGDGGDRVYGQDGNDSIDGGNGNDYLYGDAGNDIILGGAGDDSLSGDTGDDTLIGGAGNDSLYGWLGSDTYVFNRGDGQDWINTYDIGTGQTDVLQFGEGIAPGDIKITRSGDALILSIKDTTDKVTISQYFYQEGVSMWKLDLIRFADGTVWDIATVKLLAIQGTDEADTLNAYATADIMAGGAGNDTLYGWGGDDTLDGGTGNDALTGGAGSDTYLFGRGGGQDSINNNDAGTGKTDVLQFAADIAPGDIEVTRSSDNLILTIAGTTDKVTIQSYFNTDGAGVYKLEEIRFADGTVWNVDAVKALAITGTDGADTLNGYASADTISGGAGNDALYGRGGDDMLYGGAGNDTQNGDAGNDILDGGAGNDTLNGGAGSDTYLFGRGGGQDTISNYDTTAGKVDVLQFAADIAPGDISISRYSYNLYLTIAGTTDRVMIQSYFYADATGGYALDEIRFADGTVWDVDAVKALAITGTDGADTLTGYATADVMEGGTGNDLLYGQGGNDTLYGGEGNDTLHGQDGDDTLEGGAGSDSMQGYNGNDTLRGGADSDYLYGGAGNDVLDGGTSNDYLSGDYGNDTYLFGRGGGLDTVSEGDATAGNTDVAQFLEGVSSDQIWFRRSGNNLEASIIGTSDKLTISNWYLGNQYHVEQFKTADGQTLVDSKVESLVQAMAAFSPPAAGQTTLPTNYQTALQPVLAANWQ